MIRYFNFTSRMGPPSSLTVANHPDVTTLAMGSCPDENVFSLGRFRFPRLRRNGRFAKWYCSQGPSSADWHTLENWMIPDRDLSFGTTWSAQGTPKTSLHKMHKHSRTNFFIKIAQSVSNCFAPQELMPSSCYGVRRILSLPSWRAISRGTRTAVLKALLPFGGAASNVRYKNTRQEKYGNRRLFFYFFFNNTQYVRI